MRQLARLGAGCGLVLLAACGAAGPEVTAQSPDAAVPAITAGPQQQAGIRGEAVAVSDVQGVPDSPIRDGYVLAVPAGAAAALWAAADRGAPQEHELPYWNPSVPREILGDAGGSVAAIDGEGRFALDVPAGDYLLCLGRGDDPLAIAGCSRLALTGGDVLRLTFGEGGVEVGIVD